MNTSKLFKVFGVLVLCLGSANVVDASAWSGSGEPNIVRGSGSEMVSSVGAKATVVPASCSGTAPTANARIRSGPGTVYGVVSSAKKCERISVTGRNSANDWLQLATGGWISRALVVNAPASLPVVNAPAAPTVVAVNTAQIVFTPTALPVPTATALPVPTATVEPSPTPVPVQVAPVAPSAGSGGGSNLPVKKSRRDICHAPGTRWYDETVNYTSYNTLQECLDSGGRMPRG